MTADVIHLFGEPATALSRAETGALLSPRLTADDLAFLSPVNAIDAARIAAIPATRAAIAKREGR